MSGASKPPDPFKVLRESYEQATEAWAQAVEQAISTEEFAASAGKVMERYTEMQEVLRKTSEAVAEQLHIPTKDDIARVAQLVINVERKIDDVSDQADALGRRDPAEAVAGLAERLATIEERIAGIAARLDAIDRIESRLGELATARATAEPAPPAAPAAPAPAARRTRAKKADATPASPAPAPRRRSTRTTAKEE